MKFQRHARWAIALASAAMFALGQGAPALAASASEMRDLPADHWAYKAIQQLMERYGVMEGFPDQTFRGTKTVSRYELAAALNKVMQRMDALAAQKPGTPSAPSVTAADKAMVDRLKSEFRAELDTLEGRVKKNEDTLKELQDKIAKVVTVGGRVRTQIADETLDAGKDRSAPYLGTELTVKVKGTISPSTTYDTAIGGAVKAAGSGDVPGAMQDALGKTPADNNITVKTARFTTKIGATTINVGRFPLWLVGFGPGTDQSFHMGDFIVGAGAVGTDVSSLRVGTDIGAALDTTLGPVEVLGALNSNTIAAQLAVQLGPVKLKGGYDIDHKAITSNWLGNGPRVKTTDNAAVVLDFGGEGPFGGTVQANLTNEALTSYGGGLRGTIRGIDLNLVTVLNSDPGKAVTVASFSGAAALPAYTLPWGGLKTPTLVAAAEDHYTIDAPPSAKGPTTGPGGQALGKNAGLSLQLGLENPIIPNLVFEYNLQAKLIEDIFLPSDADPITSETLLFRSTIDF